MSKIGIRLADGKFYPVLDDDVAEKKDLVVTTVKDNQPSVQIDVYRSSDAENTYIGSLIIDNIPPMPAKEPNIQLDLELDKNGNLNAFAREEKSGEHQALSVSLTSLSEEEKYEVPDFDFQEDDVFDMDTDTLPETDTIEIRSIDDESGKKTFEHIREDEDEPQRRRRSPLLIGLLAALITALVLLAAWFIYKYTSSQVRKEPATKVEAPKPAPVVVTPTPPPAQTAQPAPVQPAAQPVQAPSASDQNTQEGGKKTGTWYKIKWGDTLWDISMAYYRNPWLYPTIAKANKIKNPDLIISATWIYIPPR